MAIDDVIYTNSDYFELELTGITGTVSDVLFDNPLTDEITGINGPTNDVLFDDNTLNEIPKILITDFGFL